MPPPERDLLTGERAGDVLQTALLGWPGSIPGFRYTVDRVHCRPGAETSVGYHVWRETEDPPVPEYLVATTARVETPLHAEVDGLRVAVWRHPGDPSLPALAAACSPQRLRSWLVDAGAVPAEGERAASTLVTYRPLRRAVIRTTVGPGTWFVKVVRPTKAEKLVLRQRLLDAAGIGARVVAVPGQGAVITAAAPGRSLASVLAAAPPEPAALPTPAGVVDLLDRLPAAVADLNHRPSWTDRVAFSRDMAALALPEHAGEIAAMAAEIHRLAFAFAPGAVVPTHGDVHPGNIFCTGGRPATLIDVDGLGPGHRVDDLACLVGHLATLGDAAGQRHPRAPELAHAWAAAFEQAVHPGSLRTRVAAVLLSLVAGGSRARSLGRLDLARAWLYRARAARAD